MITEEPKPSPIRVMDNHGRIWWRDVTGQWVYTTKEQGTTTDYRCSWAFLTAMFGVLKVMEEGE